MKKRNLVAVFVLSIVTFGIYDLYWLSKTRKELNSKTSVKVPTIWLLFVPFILFVISFIAFIAVAANKSANNTVTYGATTTTTTSSGAGIFIVLYFLAIILLFVISFFWFFKFSKAVNEYTDGKMNTAITFLLLWILHLIGVVLVQDTFNDMIDAGNTPSQPAASPVPTEPAATPAQPINDVAPAPAQPESAPEDNKPDQGPSA